MRAPQGEALLAAAFRIVVADGLAGLTLRPLAQALGVSVTVLTNRYGGRADIMAAICGAAAAHDAVLLDGWRETLAALGPLPPVVAAGLAEAILEEQSTSGRALSALYLEFLHACTWDETLRPAFAGWAGQRRAFWDDFAGRAALAPPLVACGWWSGYVIAELAYGLALEGDASYRMLRRLGVQRLFAGAVAGLEAADSILFGLLRERMGAAEEADTEAGAEAEAGAETGTSKGRAPAWSAQAARACGLRLAARGIDGLTHRAIAADIGIAHTTLSYRFPTQRDLVIAGLACIAGHIRAAVEADSLAGLQRRRAEADGLDPARASFAVALAAVRLPELARQTAYMRAWRGSNLVNVFARYLPEARGIDALCAQVISLGLTGLTNTMPPGADAEEAVATAYAAAGRWLRGAG
ncbi:TetR family transcriptional regulator [Pseudoduganella umbonata]|uniref:AcrR family transcriptional regulator n=1 Tax=Pseudoduganella umbonata TaxID=864828 RepID=A0A4P8HIF8_9BURK|nr:TetR family transcriptional regulator [Pseudoduganella umbonata]MBB3219327.1 AcrR family transcriptional regulator [Pseudoduganella umbonata]QCP09429.1 helix-turn-helix transcriptional regulator [Pseudoduganella umbonata]